VHVFSQSELLTWIVALVILEVLHLKWIWLSEWDCRRCKQKNLACDCPRRWARHI